MAAPLRDRILGLETVRLDDIIGFIPGNPVARNDGDRAQLSASLRINGYAMPVELRKLTPAEALELGKKYEMLDGHGRMERIQAEYPDTVELKALILDVATAAEGRALLLGLRHQASWGIDELESWMREARSDGMELEDALELSMLTDEDLDALAEDVAEDLDADDSGDAGGGDGSDEKEVEVAGHTRKIGGHKVRPPAQMTVDDWTMRLGDSAEKLLELPPNSIDAMVTDPPAGIAFMSKGWDTDKGGRANWIAWLAGIMAAALRAMKPGAHGLVWALPRTQHWTMTALEDAGFEIRDVVYHAFGSGFPKSLNVSKAIDAKLGAEREPDQYTGANHKNEVYGEGMGGGVTLARAPAATPEAAEQDGRGTALKPALEPWILVRKPISEPTLAENAMRWGTGGINIDGCRIGSEVRFNGPSGGSADGDEVYALGMRGKGEGTVAEGRWPAHFVMTHAPECVVEGDAPACVDGCPARMLDEQSGITKDGVSGRNRGFQKDGYVGGATDTTANLPRMSYGGEGGASRFFKVNKLCVRNASDADPNSTPNASDEDSVANHAQDPSTAMPAMSPGGAPSDSSEASTSATPSASRPSNESDTETIQSTERRCSPEPRHADTYQIDHAPSAAPRSPTDTTTTTTSLATSDRSVGDATSSSTPETSDPGAPASRIMYVPKPSRSETEAGLDALEVHTAGELTEREDGSKGLQSPRAGAGRGGGRRNVHPTKKPIELMRYFVRLVAPPARDGTPPTILDPFAGSGTTGLAALVEGCRFLGIEKETQYHRIASERLRTIVEDPRTIETADDDAGELADDAPATEPAA